MDALILATNVQLCKHHRPLGMHSRICNLYGTTLQFQLSSFMLYDRSAQWIWSALELYASDLRGIYMRAQRKEESIGIRNVI